MRPIFTIRAGEFIVGEHLERSFKGINIWVPTKDTGVDLLATNSTNTKGISFQVKFSRDYLTTHLDAEFQKPLRACGWFTLDREKIVQSSAQFWILLVIGSKARSRDYVIIRPTDFLKRLERIHGAEKKFQVYLWITEKDTCWETRGLTKSEQLEIAKDTFADKERDFTAYLNNWEMVQSLIGANIRRVPELRARMNSDKRLQTVPEQIQ